MTSGAFPRRRWVFVVIALELLIFCGGGRSWSSPVFSPSAIEVDVIGDSLSTGLATGGFAWTDAAARTFARDRPAVRFLNAAENGSGYVARGQHGDTFLDEVERVVSARTQIVLVFGSDNDLGMRGLSTAVARTLRRIRALAPSATLIVVGPPAPPAQQVQRLAGIRDTIEETTRGVAGQFVDALALKWFQGDAKAYVGPDHEHPNDSGEQYLAARMTAVLAPAIRAAAHRRRAAALPARATTDPVDRRR